MKLALGTVQFGLDYGISNCTGKTPKEEVHNILDYAKNHGINTLDTSCSYGNAESVLGSYKNLKENFSIITKAPAFKDSRVNYDHAKQLIKTLNNSLHQLQSSAIYALLIHQCDDLFKPGGECLYQALQQQKSININ